MIKMYKSTTIEPGEYKAMVTAVEVIDNNFYDETKPEDGYNSKNQLNITLTLENGYNFEQKFVRPTEDSLFGQLCSIAGLSGENINETDIIGVECIAIIVLDKNNYKKIYDVKSDKKKA